MTTCRGAIRCEYAYVYTKLLHGIVKEKFEREKRCPQFFLTGHFVWSEISFGRKNRGRPVSSATVTKSPLENIEKFKFAYEQCTRPLWNDATISLRHSRRPKSKIPEGESS